MVTASVFTTSQYTVVNRENARVREKKSVRGRERACLCSQMKLLQSAPVVLLCSSDDQWCEGWVYSSQCDCTNTLLQSPELHVGVWDSHSVVFILAGCYATCLTHALNDEWSRCMRENTPQTFESVASWQALEWECPWDFKWNHKALIFLSCSHKMAKVNCCKVNDKWPQLAINHKLRN